MQSGFDAGYPLGVEVGLRAGVVLGVLEGIVAALESDGGHATSSTLSGKGAGGNSGAAGSVSRGKSKKPTAALDDLEDGLVSTKPSVPTHNAKSTTPQDQRSEQLQRAKTLLQQATNELKITELMRDMSDEVVIRLRDDATLHSQVESVLQRWESVVSPVTAT